MRERPPRLPAAKPVAGFLAMVSIWGSTFLVIRIGNDSLPPAWGAMLRLGIAALLNALVVLVTRPRPVDRRALPAVLLFGFLNLGVGMTLLYWGEQRVPSAIAAVLFATLPIATGILAWLFGVQPIAVGQIMGSIVGFLGVALIFSSELRLGAPAQSLAAVFTGALCATAAGVILKKAPPQPPFLVNAIACAVGATVAGVASLLLGEPHVLPRTFAGWWPVVYLAVLGNLGAFVLYVWLVGQWKVTRVHTSSLITPIIAVALGAVVRRESLAPMAYVGALLVLSGVGWTIVAERRGPTRKPGAQPPR